MENNSKDKSGIAMLDTLINQAGLYRTSKQFTELLDFAIRLRNIAPFNAMLLQIQKPGLRFAASETDWHIKFGRSVKTDARPLLIMWPFCPVALVYDMADTTGPELPADVAQAFRTKGSMDETTMQLFIKKLSNKHIKVDLHDFGDGNAGSISESSSTGNSSAGKQCTYALSVNKNHETPVQFSTLTHELGHLFLGHLGENKTLKIPLRNGLSLAQEEVEAESVAYIVCKRHGLEADSDKYLSQFQDEAKTPKMAIYQIMRAAGQIEQLLGISGKKKIRNSHEQAQQLSLPLSKNIVSNVNTPF